MNTLDLRTSLPLLPTPTGSCGCCAPRTTSDPTPTTDDAENQIGTVDAFAVTGMTCGHCVVAVTDEVSAIPGVTDVTVDLAPNSTSTLRVISEQGVTRDQIAAALDEAGDYRLTTD